MTNKKMEIPDSWYHCNSSILVGHLYVAFQIQIFRLDRISSPKSLFQSEAKLKSART